MTSSSEGGVSVTPESVPTIAVDTLSEKSNTQWAEQFEQADPVPLPTRPGQGQDAIAALSPNARAKAAEDRWVTELLAKDYTIAWLGRTLRNPHPKMLKAVLNGLATAGWISHVSKFSNHHGKSVRILCAKNLVGEEKDDFHDPENAGVIPTGGERFVVLTPWEVRQKVQGGVMSKEEIAKLHKRRQPDGKRPRRRKAGDRSLGRRNIRCKTSLNEKGYGFGESERATRGVKRPPMQVFIHVSECSDPSCVTKGAMITAEIILSEDGRYRAEDCEAVPPRMKHSEPDKDGFTEVLGKKDAKEVAEEVAEEVAKEVGSPAKSPYGALAVDSGSESDGSESDGSESDDSDSEPYEDDSCYSCEEGAAGAAAPGAAKAAAPAKGKKGKKGWVKFELD